MTILLLNANALHIPLADGSVNCVVTSPPYYGLRDYGTAEWQGGDPECDHTYQKGGRNPETSSKQISNAGTTFSQYEHVCKRCGAVRIDKQIGLEETPEAYVEKLVAVFREVRRVLSSGGGCWLNLGDSYAGSGGAGGDYNEGGMKEGQPRYKSNLEIDRSKRNSKRWGGGNLPATGDLKPKDLIGIPWMVAFALRADGWYLRSEIIWHKPNPMPESVTDRPTKAHEQIFLLSKSPRYFYDHEAIMEPVTNSSIARLSQDVENQKGSTRANGGAKTNGNMKAVHKNLQYSGQKPRTMHIRRAEGLPDTEYQIVNRNKRTVWTVATQPYSGAHFATFPAQLIEPCIKAGCPKDGIVLDPFSGSGTTVMVARKLGRRAIGLDLSFTYIQECARPRLQLSDLEEWESGKKAESNYSDLPLFTETE